jgi:hypothetical protein
MRNILQQKQKCGGFDRGMEQFTKPRGQRVVRAIIPVTQRGVNMKKLACRSANRLDASLPGGLRTHL